MQEISNDWLIDYNEVRPHESLDRVPPLTGMPRGISVGESNVNLKTRRGRLRSHALRSTGLPCLSTPCT